MKLVPKMASPHYFVLYLPSTLYENPIKLVPTMATPISLTWYFIQCTLTNSYKIFAKLDIPNLIGFIVGTRNILHNVHHVQMMGHVQMTMDYMQHTHQQLIMGVVRLRESL